MATYVCSDLHGQYNLFIKLLDIIKFSTADCLYVLGDIIDKGSQSLKLLDFIRQQPNIHCILGNHEYSFLQFYNTILQDNEFDKNKELTKLQTYFSNDNHNLTWDIVYYMTKMPFYIETESFIGVHAGLELDENNNIIPIKNQSENYMIFDRRFKSTHTNNNLGKPILFGHTPCNYENDTGEFIKIPNIQSNNIKDYNKIRLDTGSITTNMLGILRVDDMKEFYVKY